MGTYRLPTPTTTTATQSTYYTPSPLTTTMSQLESDPDTLTGWGRLVLLTPDIERKAFLTERALEWWSSKPNLPIGDSEAPDDPSRPSQVSTVNPKDAPRRGKGGTLHSRQAIIHSIVHIESWAIDLSWDMLVRFRSQNDLPVEFFEDWLRIAAEEAKHYRMLRTRLEQLGSSYGSLPVHDGLWQSAKDTSFSILARLAVEHMVHEGRGLDILPNTVARLQKNGDHESAELLLDIHQDEITHVGSGYKWFNFVCQQQGIENPKQHFQDIVRTHFRGLLKPPFNKESRSLAGFPEEWYVPLSKPLPESSESTPATASTSSSLELATS